jgi:hypothetical protein
VPVVPVVAAQTQRFEMKPIATSETKQEQRRGNHKENFELENLDIRCRFLRICNSDNI